MRRLSRIEYLGHPTIRSAIAGIEMVKAIASGKASGAVEISNRIHATLFSFSIDSDRFVTLQNSKVTSRERGYSTVIY